MVEPAEVATVIEVGSKVFDIFSGLDSKQKCLIEVKNDTGCTLKLKSDKHSSGGFATLPENEILPGGKDAFISHDTGILRGALGEVTYTVVDHDGTTELGTWLIRWGIPQVGTPSCSQEVKGLDPQKAKPREPRIGDGDETEAKFELEGPGGGSKGETKKKEPVDPNLKSTVLIEVKNNTDQTLTLLDQGHDHGGFITTPAAQIAPGAEDSFASFETDRAAPGSQGFLKYGVGDTSAEWTIKWNNPESADNTSDSVLDGDDADQFVGLDQIGGGEENVPAVFTIAKGRGGGKRGVPPVPQGTKDSVEVTIVNQSNRPLTFLDKGSFSGEFVTDPAADIPVGGTATFSCAETPDDDKSGCQGFVRYHAGEPGTCLFTMLWNNPENGENSTSFSLDGPDAERYTVDGTVGAEQDNAQAVFTLSGGPDDPEDKEPEFAPPVEQDEPTLRLGDQSVDGWVEYLQMLLNTEGFGPLPVDGNFDNAVLAAVRAFQTQRKDEDGGKIQVDGVVGHQTWAALREEAPRQPSTDGRKPHTYVEAGAEARFFTEDSAVDYLHDGDLLTLTAANTGDETIQPNTFEATARITFPSGESHTFVVPLSNGGRPIAPGDMCFFEGTIEAAINRALDEPGTYHLEAYMPQELGGDQTEKSFTLP